MYSAVLRKNEIMFVRVKWEHLVDGECDAVAGRGWLAGARGRGRRRPSAGVRGRSSRAVVKEKVTHIFHEVVWESVKIVYVEWLFM